MRYILSTAIMITTATTTAAPMMTVYDDGNGATAAVASSSSITKRIVRRWNWLTQTTLTHSKRACIMLWDDSTKGRHIYIEFIRILYIMIDFTWACIRLFLSCCFSVLRFFSFFFEWCSRDLMDMSLYDYHWSNWQIELAAYFSTDRFHWKEQMRTNALASVCKNIVRIHRSEMCWWVCVYE